MKPTASDHNKERRRGQSLVEAALVLVVALVTIVGALDFGQVMFIHQSLVERVRAGARYAALNSGNLDAARNLVVYGSPRAPEQDGDSQPPAGFLGLSTSMVSVTRQGANTSDDRVVVRIEGYPFRFFSPFIGGVYTAKPIVATAPVEL